MNGMSYSSFVRGLKAANVDLDRKVLADIAATDPPGFTGLVEVARGGLGT
jgi:large subunit ribosomal protein L20